MMNIWKAKQHHSNKAIIRQWGWSMHQPKIDDIVILDDESGEEIIDSWFLGYQWFFLKVWCVTWENDQKESPIETEFAA